MFNPFVWLWWTIKERLCKHKEVMFHVDGIEELDGLVLTLVHKECHNCGKRFPQMIGVDFGKEKR